MLNQELTKIQEAIDASNGEKASWDSLKKLQANIQEAKHKKKNECNLTECYNRMFQHKI